MMLVAWSLHAHASAKSEVAAKVHLGSTNKRYVNRSCLVPSSMCLCVSCLWLKAASWSLQAELAASWWVNL